jgi:hypothetical protein
MQHLRLFRMATLGLTMAAVAAPTAGASQDLRSPDAIDAGSALQQVQPQQPAQDLRSPDAADAAQGSAASTPPRVTVVKVSEPAPSSSSFDWGDAGIGAGAALGLLLIGLAGVLVAIHRRHGAPPARRHGTTTA